MIGSDFIRQNPCRYCALGYTDKYGRSYPSFRDECYQCENNKKHKEYLTSQRKFQQGDPITTMDDLLNQKWVIWNGFTKHIEFIKSFQLRFVFDMLNKKTIYKAIGREEQN